MDVHGQVIDGLLPWPAFIAGFLHARHFCNVHSPMMLFSAFVMRGTGHFIEITV